MATPVYASDNSTVSRTLSQRSKFTRVYSTKEKDKSDSADHTYVVDEPVLVVDPTALLMTRPGAYLLQRHWMSPVLHFICFVCILLYFIPIGQTVTYEADDSTGMLRTLERPALVQTAIGSILTILGMSLNAHQMNRQIFIKCVLSFDFMVIVGSGTLIQLVWYVNWYIVFAGAGQWCVEEIPVMAVEFIANIGFYVTIASMDCITMRYTRKVSICCILMASFLAEFVIVRFQYRYDNFFADETLDWWLISTTPDEIYLSSKLQLMLFLGKASFAYFYGHPFCCIKPEYEVPGRSVLPRRVVRQLSEITLSGSLRSNSTEQIQEVELKLPPDISSPELMIRARTEEEVEHKVLEDSTMSEQMLQMQTEDDTHDDGAILSSNI